MSKLSNISKSEAEELARAFPGLQRALENYADPLNNRVAISVFDRWLGKDVSLLDCKTQGEREERNARMLCFWQVIFELTDVYTYKSSLQRAETRTVEFMRYLNKASYLEDCAYKTDRTSDQFQFIVLPEFLAVYQEDWDDANVLWFVSREKVEPLLKRADDCGLFAIEYAF